MFKDNLKRYHLFVAPSTITHPTDRQKIDVGATIEYYLTLQKAGAEGLLVLGTTGRGHEFPHAEKTALLQGLGEQIAAGKFRPDFPILTGLGTVDGQEAAELLLSAVFAGLSGVVALPPPRGSKLIFYERLANLCEQAQGPFSMLLYNHPRLDKGYQVYPGLLKKLVTEHKSIVGIKDSAGDLDTLLDWKRTGGNDFWPITAIGDDQLIAQGLEVLEEETIIISGSGNTPEGLEFLQLIVSAARHGRWTTARRLQEDFNTLIQKLLAGEGGFAETVLRQRIGA